MTVQELIDELNKVEDRSKEVVEFNPDNGLYDVSFVPVFTEQENFVHVTVY